MLSKSPHSHQFGFAYLLINWKKWLSSLQNKMELKKLPLWMQLSCFSIFFWCGFSVKTLEQVEKSKLRVSNSKIKFMLVRINNKNNIPIVSSWKLMLSLLRSMIGIWELHLQNFWFRTLQFGPQISCCQFSWL